MSLLSVVHKEEFGNAGDLIDNPWVGFYSFHASLLCFLLLGIVSQINYLQVFASSSNFMGIKKQLPQFRKWRNANKNSDFPLPLKHERPGNPESKYPMAAVSWN